jgi:C4-dicarboxylate-specific signal transduction histidine kinase
MGSKADARELSILKQINEKRILEVKDVVNENGSKFLYVAMPVQTNKESCMKCHSKPDIAPAELVARYGDKAGFYENVGRVRAIISIKASLDDELREADKLFYMLSFALLVAMVSIFGGATFMMSKITSKERIIGQKNRELQALNDSLEQKIKSETDKRVEKEKLLIQQSKMATMGEMIGAIAHQWRQPLNALALTVQDIEMAYQFNELNDEYLARFKQESMSTIQAMSQTIEDFRNFFSPNKKPEKFVIEDAIKESLKMLESQLKLHSVEIIFNTDISNNHEYICYKNELKQVLLNILANAKDALFERKPQNPFIKIEVNTKEDDNNKLEIVIEDSAGGIATDIIDKVFEPYFTTKEEGKGTGIGLYMSKQIVEESLHGTLSVSNAESGARFVVELDVMRI